MPVLHLLLGLYLLFLSGCGVIIPSLEDMAEENDDVAMARQFLEMRQFKEAHAISKQIILRFPNCVTAWRCYQDSLKIGADKKKTGEEPAQIALEEREFEKNLENCSPEIRHYLRARSSPILTSRIRNLEQIATQSLSFAHWVYLDIAQLYLIKKDYAQCKKALDTAISKRPNFGEAYLLAAWIYLRQANWQKAIYCARKAREYAPYLIKPYFFEAAHCMIYGEYLTSLHWMKKVKLQFPFYVFNADEQLGFQSAFWRELILLQEKNCPQTGLKTADEAVSLFPEQPIFLTFQAEFLLQLGREKEAEIPLKKALSINPYNLRTVQLYRRFLFRRHAYSEALSLWYRLVPKEILYNEENLLRDIYIELENSVREANPKNPATLLRMARALSRAGWERESWTVYTHIPSAYPLPSEEKESLQRHIRFMDALKKLCYQYYENGGLNIVQIMDNIQKIATKYHIPFHASPSREFQSYFIVVREADPFHPKTGTLGDYMSRYNKVIDLGNNYGYIDIRIMNRISIRKHCRTIWNSPAEYWVIMGDETLVDTFLGHHSGSSKVAGRAFLSGKGFYIALDTIRPGLMKLKNLHYRMHNPESIKLEELEDRGGEYTYSQSLSDLFLKKSLESLSINKVVSSSQEWDSFYKEILLREIDLVHNHELGHTMDFPCFLPVYANLGNIFSMLYNQGFSPERIQTRFESIADAFGLAHTKDPYYYLFQLIERTDVSFEGIFELVYWAWYGRVPKEDPYYATAIALFQYMLNIAPFEEKGRLEWFASCSKEKLDTALETLCKKMGISQRCQ